MSSNPAEPAGSNLKLPESMGPLLAGALMRGKPVVVSYTDDAGKPHVSFRGSVQRYSDTQLALWHRDPSSGIAAALPKNSHVSLLYGDLDPENRAVLTFNGRGRVDTSEEVRRVVYDAMPSLERERDAEFKGVAVIIDLDDVTGLYEGAYFMQKR